MGRVLGTLAKSYNYSIMATIMCKFFRFLILLPLIRLSNRAMTFGKQTAEKCKQSSLCLLSSKDINQRMCNRETTANSGEMIPNGTCCICEKLCVRFLQRSCYLSECLKFLLEFCAILVLVSHCHIF